MRLDLLLAAGLPLGAVAQLNDLAKAAGLLYFGTAANPGDVNDAGYYALERNTSIFGQYVPENDQKWEVVEPQRHVFNFRNADALIDRARDEGKIMRCHTLVWHSQLPPWVSGKAWTKRSLECVIRSHIINVMGHFKGKCYAWDVVNEALEDDGTYRQSVFYKTLGDKYFEIAFKQAGEVDPAEKLYYNDYNLEYFPIKADAAVKIVQLIQASGAPIHGVGLQAHMTVGRTPSRANLTWTLNKFTSLGLHVAYTELDVRIKTLPSNATTLAAQADEYEWIVGSCVDTARCVGVTVWGFGDAHSWIPGTFPGAGDSNLYDKDNQPKPALRRVEALLRSAAGKRPPWPAAPAIPAN